MKKLLVLAMLLFPLQLLQAAEEIQFEHNAWGEILAKATQEKKIIFMDAFTTWCGPCKWMAKTAFVDPKVAEFFNANFVNAKIDMEKGEGIELAKLYNVNAYPTLLFVDGNGTLVHTAIGARSAADLLQLGQDVIKGNFKNIPAMKAKFDAGERDRVFLKDYILALAESMQDYEEPLSVFEIGMKGDALLNQENWAVFNAVIDRFDSQFVTYFLNNRATFEKNYGKKDVQEKAIYLYYSGVADAASSQDKAAYKDLRAEFSHSGIAAADSILPALDMLWTQYTADWKGYAKACKAFLDKTNSPNPMLLNQIAWTFYEQVNGKSDLEQALKWINTSVAAEPSYANIDTQAMVLYKLGKKTEAIAAAERAIAMGKAAGEDVKATEEALELMRAK